MSSVETPTAPETKEEVQDTQGTKRQHEDDKKEESIKDLKKKDLGDDCPKQKVLKTDHKEGKEDEEHAGNGKAAAEEKEGEEEAEGEDEDGEELGDEEDEEGDLDGELEGELEDEEGEDA